MYGLWITFQGLIKSHFFRRLKMENNNDSYKKKISLLQSKMRLIAHKYESHLKLVGYSWLALAHSDWAYMILFTEAFIGFMANKDEKDKEDKDKE